MPWSDAEFVPEDPNRAKLEQYYEREKLKKLYGSAVSHDGTAFVATVSVRKPVYGAAASSWADIAEQHEGRAAAADGGDEPRRKRSRSADKQKKKKRKKEGKRHKKKKHKKERQRGEKKRRRESSSSSSGSSSDASDGGAGASAAAAAAAEGVRRQKLIDDELARQALEARDERCAALADGLLRAAARGAADRAAPAGGAEPCPLRFLARHSLVAWQVTNPDTGNVRRAQQIGENPKGPRGSESSDW